ncbi:MmpS family transport accessory protein [Mycobacterium sp. IS-1556]|uniref:MmpS family transport accessory protein n=1 Tax=Mycobacterium sp. IS-1556 TaxID=1772276 RepID=UPI0007417BC0|nr:MmpS family transport accessory protein [Mycobacterium sp. IS-1556]KUH83924.1 hypothetical protein AU187_07635 [Mycobacterium sp. IS-1556]
MSGPNPPDDEGADFQAKEPSQEPRQEPDQTAGDQPAPDTSETEFYSRAYSAPESEQFTAGPYVPADASLYDYDSYEPGDPVDQHTPPRWPWVVGVAAIVAAIALVASVSVLVTRTDTDNLATPETSTTTVAPPVQDEITTTTPPAPATTQPPSPPPTTTRAGPRQVTYSVTGTKAPGDIITVTYIDASGRSRTQRNVYIPWSLTVTPISQSEVGSVQASSLFLVSRLNCSITTSDGTVLSSNTNNSAQTSC